MSGTKVVSQGKRFRNLTEAPEILVLQELQTQGTTEYFDDLVTFQDRERIVNTAHYLNLQERFLRED